VQIKHITTIDWSDLPRIESPFFARAAIERDRSTTLSPGVSWIGGLNEALREYTRMHSPRGPQTDSRAAFNWLLGRVDDGEYVFVNSDGSTPMSSVLRWSTGENSKGYCVPLVNGKVAEDSTGFWKADPDLPIRMRRQIEERLEKARRAISKPENQWWVGLLLGFRRGSGKADAPELKPPPFSAKKLSPSKDKPVPVGNESKTVGVRKDRPMPTVLAGGTANAKDVALVRIELKKMPEKYRQMLMDNNTQFVVVRGSITEYYTDLQGVQPRGWPPGTTWDTVPGAGPSGGNNTVVIAIRGHGTPNGPYVPPTGDGHGSYNLVLHEAAHALPIDLNSAQTQAFRDARTADFGSLSDYQKQAGDAGLQETFAESFANVFGGNANFANTHPNLDRYWKGLP
jgi:hypothetical protein